MTVLAIRTKLSVTNDTLIYKMIILRLLIVFLVQQHAMSLTTSELNTVSSICAAFAQGALSEAGITERLGVMEAAHENTQKQLQDTVRKLEEATGKINLLRSEIEAEKQRSNIGQSTSPMDKRLLLDTPTTTTDQVAFHADLSYDLHDLTAQEVIPFDQVITNVGQGYNATSGVFTCPVSGLYVFQAAVFAAYNDHIELEMVQDGKPIVNMYAAGSSSASHGYDQGFNAMVVQCNIGQNVWVRVHESKGMTVASYRMTSFSGYIIYKSGWV